MLVSCIGDALLQQVMDEAEPHWRAGNEWNMIDYALREWQVRVHNPLAAAWHVDLLRWLVAARGASQPLATLAGELHRLCATHWVAQHWELIAPGAVTTLACITPVKIELGQLAAEGLTLRLTNPQLDTRHKTETWRPLNRIGSRWSWLDTALLVTLFDYVEITYGRDHVFALARASRHHESWHSLIPALFAVSVAEFEQGWQEYVKEEVGR
jgi:hypothetical protein